MAKKRRPIPAAPDASALPAGVMAIPLQWLVSPHEPQRPGREDQLRDRLWRDLRREVEELFMCTELDLRRLVFAEDGTRAAMESRRRVELQRHFADDPRVAIDDDTSD